MTYDLAPPLWEPNGEDSYYNPCRTGLHFCGEAIDDDAGSQPYTALNIIYNNPVHARLAFERAKEAATCEQEAESFIVDLQVNDECEDDFYTNRQLFPALIAALTPSKQGGA